MSEHLDGVRCRHEDLLEQARRRSAERVERRGRRAARREASDLATTAAEPDAPAG